MAQTPPGYMLRTYLSGDEPRFFEIMGRAGWPDWNQDKLRPWLWRIVPDGWFMAVHIASQTIVATAMATHDHTWRRPFCGEVGWVAADPAHIGKGLGQALVAAVTARFLAIGYPIIHLYSEPFRLAALKIYLKQGYVPLISSSAALETWQTICQRLGWSYTPGAWEQATAAV